MTDNKDLKYTQTFKKEPNVPKTYEQFILEEQSLEQQKSYPDLTYEDISEQRRHGPCLTTYNCTCKPEELRSQAEQLLRLAEKREREQRTHFFLNVEVINSSGSGIGGTGQTVVKLYSIAEAEEFINQVNDEWVASCYKWMSVRSREGGLIKGWITSEKRQKICRAVRCQIDRAKNGINVGKTLQDSDIQNS